MLQTTNIYIYIYIYIYKSFGPQDVISYDIPLQRVLMELPVLLWRHDLLLVQENRGFLDAQRNPFLSRNETPVNFLDLDLTLSLLCEFFATGFPVLDGICEE